MEAYEELKEPKTDESLAESIRNMIARIENISCRNIRVQVNAGRVFLEGKVRSEKERNLIRHCISGIFGVRSVANYLTFPRKVR